MLIFSVLTKFKFHSILIFILRLKKKRAQPEDSNELFQKLLEDLKELAEYKESLENSSKEIAVSNSNQEKEDPPQDSDIRQLIREECCVEVSEEQKQKMEDTILVLVKICRQKELYCIHDNVEDLIESALNSKLLSINLNSQCLDKKEQEVKNVLEQPAERGTHVEKSLRNFRVIHEKSNAENLLPIPSECEVSSKDKIQCDVPAKDDCFPAFTTFSNPLFNNDDLDSSDDESLSEEDVPAEEFKNDDDSDGEVDAVEELRVDNSISNTEHEYSESEKSDFDNPSVPLTPSEPPDEELDFEIDFGVEISVVRNTIVEFDCIDARVKFDVSNDENDGYSYFMFVMVFSFLFAESEDTIFDP
nr:hypothetical protein [Tanacetum cinerariifolium]